MFDPQQKTPFLAFAEANKGVVHCARLHEAAHWPNNNANSSGLSEKKFIVQKCAICAILSEKTPFLAFPKAKKGVVHCARLHKAGHWPNNNANPSGISEKKVYCVEKRDMSDPWRKTPFFSFPEAKKGVVHCARLGTGLIITQIPRGYQKKVYCVEKRDMCDPQRKNPIFSLPKG